MARLKVHDRWTVLPHLAIERLAENLWRVEGSLPDMPLRRVMTLARLGDGRVVVHGAIALAEAEMALVEEWGPPSFLLVPCGCHLLDAKAYRERYPDICVLCPRGARRRVVRVVPVEGDYDAFPPGEAVSLEHLDGVGRAEGAMLVRSDDGTTVVLGDLVSNMPHLPGAMGWFFRHVSACSGGPRISRRARLLLVKDREALRAHLQRLANIPSLRRVVVAHHEVIDEKPATKLKVLAHSL